MSQIDIAPTVLGLLDFSYVTKFFGRDVLRSPPETDRAFVGNYQTLGYMKGDRIAVLQPRRLVEVLRLGPGDKVLGAAQDPALAAEAISFYEVAANAFRKGLLKNDLAAPELRAPAR